MSTNMSSSFAVCSIGKQDSSLKPTVAAFSFGTSSKEQLSKMYLTKELDKKRVPDCSPGPVYSISYFPGKSSPRYGFGTSQKLASSGDPYGESAIDGSVVSANRLALEDLKFRQHGSAVFGYDARDEIKNSAVTMCHPFAGMGMGSPGPTAYCPDPVVVQERRPRYTFNGRREGAMTKEQATPRRVGPGSYQVDESAIGPQYASARKTQMGYTFGRDAKSRYTPRAQGMERNTDLSSLGKQVLSTGKSSAAYGFGTSTREHPSMQNKRSGRCKRLHHPPLDLERERVKYS